MKLFVQEMLPQELDLVIEYFHEASPEHLEMLGVDPSRLPSASVLCISTYLRKKTGDLALAQHVS